MAVLFGIRVDRQAICYVVQQGWDRYRSCKNSWSSFAHVCPDKYQVLAFRLASSSRFPPRLQAL